MKTLFITAIISLFSLSLAAQQHQPTPTNKVETITIKVFGNCTQCKARIETACEVKGIKEAVWDIDTKMLKVVYVPTKITPEAIQKLVSGVGHDTEQMRAADSVYYAMPDCCLYRQNPNTHHD
jgi:copper chaperone CopZ